METSHMSKSELRAQAVELIARVLCEQEGFVSDDVQYNIAGEDGPPMWKYYEIDASDILEALHSKFTVCPRDICAEMIDAYRSAPHNTMPHVRITEVNDAGDLTQ
jgi:hypothetical protein